MSGDTANPRIWVNADVYVGDVGATAPTDTTSSWGAEWDAVGLLSEDGMTESRADDVARHYAYGGILVRTTKSKHRRSFKFTCLEDNPIVWDLVNPGSTAETDTGVTTRTVVVPGPNPKSFGIETIDGDIIRRRVIPTAEVIEVADIKYSDADMAMFELTIDIYPDGDGVLYVDITDDPQAEEAES